MLDFTPEGDVKVSLIDFGAVRVYIDENHRHLQPSQTEVFIGNMLFSSSNQMNFGTCSRKDDLISWFYIMLFLLDSIVIVPDTEPENDFRELYKISHDYKKNNSLDSLVEKMSNLNFENQTKDDELLVK